MKFKEEELLKQIGSKNEWDAYQARITFAAFIAPRINQVFSQQTSFSKKKEAEVIEKINSHPLTKIFQ